RPMREVAVISGGHQRHAREVRAERQRDAAERRPEVHDAGQRDEVNRPEGRVAELEVAHPRSRAATRAIESYVHDRKMGRRRAAATRLAADSLRERLLSVTPLRRLDIFAPKEKARWLRCCARRGAAP